MTNRPSVDDLWLEYRCSKQFRAMWDAAEENVALAQLRAGYQPPPQEEAEVKLPGSNRGGSPSYWMTQISPDELFIRDELGIGTREDFYDIQRDGPAINKRNRIYYAVQRRRLEEARRVIKRTIRM